MFTKGQKLVCIDDSNNNPWFTGIIKKGDVVTYEGIKPGTGSALFFEDQTIDSLGERAGYVHNCFRPLIGLSAKSELLEKFIEVKEASDLPIKQPDHVEV